MTFSAHNAVSAEDRSRQRTAVESPKSRHNPVLDMNCKSCLRDEPMQIIQRSLKGLELLVLLNLDRLFVLFALGGALLLASYIGSN